MSDPSKRRPHLYGMPGSFHLHPLNRVIHFSNGLEVRELRRGRQEISGDLKVFSRILRRRRPT